MTYPRTHLAVSELQEGDIVRLFDDAWGTGIVKEVSDNTVTFFRPYGTHADFKCTGGVICYTGIEQFSRMRKSDDQYFVYSRTELR